MSGTVTNGVCAAGCLGLRDRSRENNTISHIHCRVTQETGIKLNIENHHKLGVGLAFLGYTTDCQQSDRTAQISRL